MSKHDDPLDKVRSSSKLHRRLLNLDIPPDDARELMMEYEHSLAQMIHGHTARSHLIRPEFEDAWELGLHTGASLIDPKERP